jgi:hypothetical protein
MLQKSFTEDRMTDDEKFFLLAIVYFAIFLIAGVLIGNEYGTLIKLPVIGGIFSTTSYFFYRLLGYGERR